jgi:putative endonuclease
VNEHNGGLVKSTKHYLPFDIVYTKDFNSEKEARNYEKILKDRRMEKEKIIRAIENK